MSRDFSTVVDDFASEKKTPAVSPLHFDFKRFLSLRLPGVILVGVILAIPLAIAGWFLTPVEFTASAQILYRSTSGGIVERSARSLGDYDKFVNTEIAKITGDNVLLKVLQHPEITALPSIRAASDRLTYLKGRITARIVPRSELVNVTCTMENRDEALKVLEVVVDIYEEQAMNAEREEGSVKLIALNERIRAKETELAEQRQRIRLKEGAIGAIAGSVLPQDSLEAQQYRASMLDAESRVKSAENNVAAAEDMIARIQAHQTAQRANPSSPIYEFGVETLVGRDARVAALQQELVRLENEAAMLRENLKEGHPRLLALNRQLDPMRANIARQEALARTDALNVVLSQAEEDLKAAQRRVEDEKRNVAQTTERYNIYLETERDKAEQASEQVAELQQLREEAALDSQLLTTWRTQVQNMQLEEEAPARVRVVTEPYAPFTQGVARKLLMAFAGFVAGLGAGVAFGVLRELLDQQIRTPRDLARVSRLPIVASIPHLSEDQIPGDADAALVVAQHPNSIIADEYRRVLARILFPEDNAAEISSLMVVSARPGEGKTSLACNVAIALEQASRRVLLMDLNGQRPSVEKAFGLPPGPGLSDLMRGDCDQEDAIRGTAFDNLGIIGPGTRPNELAGHLASRDMMDFLEWADEHFDHIILDAPPLMLMSDAKLLAPAIDGVVFVVGAGSATLGVTSRCLRDLDLLRANTIGLVLSGLRNMRGGYLRHNRNLFYEYKDKDPYPGSTGPFPDIRIVEDDGDAVDAEVVLLPASDSKER
ncbi:MAG: AAA family ATPase [Candidatus Hydrogenedentes bacterium]|nr:AAA family ATPase [Candidatus Hydrogenedentota bacterium]